MIFPWTIINVPFFCLFCLFQYFPGTSVQGRQQKIILTRGKVVEPDWWRNNYTMGKKGLFLRNIYYQSQHMISLGVTYPSCLELAQQTRLLVFWMTSLISWVGLNVLYKVKVGILGWRFIKWKYKFHLKYTFCSVVLFFVSSSDNITRFGIKHIEFRHGAPIFYFNGSKGDQED